MNKKNKYILPFVCYFALHPNVALANVGTPLIWATIFHLYIGNAIIGIFEGLLISFLFKTRKLLTIFIFILANYFSAWTGQLGFGWFFNKANLTIYQIRLFIFIAITTMILATIILEWPLILIIFRKEKNKLRKSIKASLFAQITSYAIIIPWFLLISGTSFITKATPDKNYTKWVNKQAVIYYISIQDGDIYRHDIHNNTSQNIYDLNSTYRDDRLCVNSNEDEATSDLYALIQSEKILILKNFFTALPPQDKHIMQREAAAETWFNYGQALDLRDPDERLWYFHTGYWPIDGLTVSNKITKERTRLSLETPFAHWLVRNATVIPGDQLIFQLGQQICIFDRKSRKIGLIAEGKGPVVKLE